MLGVIVYLTRDAAMSTLKFVGSLPPKTEIVFDYAVSPSALSESDRRVHDDTSRVVAARGEPWLNYFAPRTLAADLRSAGFTRVEDLGPDEIQERYFKGRTDGLRVNGLARLVKAGR
jgi:O-methyltransferase involved in polyketide biosynthesis